ncbi:MAG: hypothetical protein LBU91_07325 [Bacteroidales bacterium]|jgi:hypothetical protein|nr:hypothetical protein [Bacteroidales bacterium]
MKKNLFISILLLCAGFGALNAQIKMLNDGTIQAGTYNAEFQINPDGVVQIGNTAAPLFDATTRF